MKYAALDKQARSHTAAALGPVSDLSEAEIIPSSWLSEPASLCALRTIVLHLVTLLSCKRMTSLRQTTLTRPVAAGPTPAMWRSWPKRKRQRRRRDKGPKSPQALSCLCWEIVGRRCREPPSSLFPAQPIVATVQICSRFCGPHPKNSSFPRQPDYQSSPTPL